MEYIKPSFEVLAMTGHPELPFQYSPDPNILMEVGGRTCYKSGKAITKESASHFVGLREKEKHMTILEHSCEGRLYDRRYIDVIQELLKEKGKYLEVSKYSRKKYLKGKTGISLTTITGSVRAWKEFELWIDEPKNYIPLTEDEIRQWAVVHNEPNLMRATVRIICDRGVTHEWVRHRPPGSSQESTRWINYLKKLIQFIIPPWVNPKNFSVWAIFNKKALADLLWLIACFGSEWIYCALIKLGWTPQQARSVLINSLKTEIVTTADLREFQHIFAQRAIGLTGKPHPQMKEIAYPMMEAFYALEPLFFNEKEISKEYVY